jgi:hypothetical protein
MQATTMRPIHAIARDIKKDWVKVNYAAKPYLDVMTGLDSLNDKYGYDSARHIVLYFICNAGTWRGPVAKAIKAELNAMLKAK